MVHKHEQLLADLEFRINQLIYLCDSLKDENLSLKAQIEERNLEIKHGNAKLEQLEQRLTSLKIANSIVLGNDKQSVDVAKAKLMKLMHDVEKCITLLKV